MYHFFLIVRIRKLQQLQSETNVTKIKKIVKENGIFSQVTENAVQAPLQKNVKIANSNMDSFTNWTVTERIEHRKLERLGSKYFAALS